jgi:hypothetical protein
MSAWWSDGASLHDPNSDNYADSTFTNIHIRYYFWRLNGSYPDLDRFG